jgi:hypothetical protein
MGAVTRFYNAVLLSEDVDGSILIINNIASKRWITVS